MILYENKRTVLVIEDNELNREMLAEILSGAYNVITAENGKEGLERLAEYGNKIALILLDIQMPVMDGYEFLDEIKNKPKYFGIPVIVTTSSDSMNDEIQCLERGASDFVIKPYNTEIVLRRSQSLIRLSETSSILNKAERDVVTGLYTKEFFFEYALRLLESNPDESFDVLCCDIESFNLLNERYGDKNGDALLKYIADRLTAKVEPHSIAGRIGGDIFAVICPSTSVDDHRAKTDEFIGSLKLAPIPNTIVHFGLYSNVSRELPISVICDNALMAIEGVKYQYNSSFTVYDEAVRQRLQREKTIQDMSELALSERQFQVYFQAKHDLAADKTGGAEALVRWTSPELGFMNPGEFIPLFEKNGFIAKLDAYMLEETCKILKSWIDSGSSVVPISVNVSRADFEKENLAQSITSLVDKYSVPHNLIHLEVTESAYIENPEIIVNTVKELKEAGFIVELDDFGSGYSSFTVITDIMPDIIKLDMSIVRNLGFENERIVITHILAMAKDLNMKTVAEGVETKEQVKILSNMGCEYAQGYYYSKPLPYADFEIYLKEKDS